MVRNTELKETSAATKLIAETVASMINKAGWSQARTGQSSTRASPMLLYESKV